MKKLASIGIISFIMVFCCVSFAAATVPLVGTWKGTAKKLTDAGVCGSVAVSLTLKQCTGTNLVNGTLVVGSISVKVVGRIDPDNNFLSVVGSQVTQTVPPVAKTGMLAGYYVPPATTSPAGITVNILSASSSASPTTSIIEYDVFTLTKQ